MCKLWIYIIECIVFYIISCIHVYKTSQGSELEKILWIDTVYVYIPRDMYRTVVEHNSISADQSEMRDVNQ